MKIEERLAAVEAELAEIKARLPKQTEKPQSWVEEIFGSFAGSAEYDEAARLGREYRESLRPTECDGATAASLEERLAAVEADVAEIKARLPEPPQPWWKRTVGVYADDPAFDEAERLGREWRQSQREEYDEE